MSDRKRFLALFLIMCFSSLPCRAGGQGKEVQNPAQSAALTQQLPVDPEVTIGRFDNGLRYYLRVNKRPENRAELRLVVNAGSVLEEDDQRGLAHFVEHMAFNGTKNFAKQDIVKFMESIGMRFGPSLNAFTSFDETVYILQVPTDKPEVMNKAFLILEDWAHNVAFDPAEIDKERGVIVEEWRLGRGAGARMQDRQLPILLQGSRYAERLPIGKKEVIESFKYDALKRFYADWYQPGLMAVIAVGDFDRSAVENLIRQHFAAFQAGSRPRTRPTFEVPDHPQTLYAIAADKEMTVTSVGIYSKLPLRDQTTVGAYREQVVERLYTGMLNRRFYELTQKPDAPFLNAFSRIGLFVRSKEAFTLNAMVKEDGIDRGLETMLTESARVARFGFTATELERQKRDLLRSLERQFTEKDKQESGLYAEEYVRNFTQREPTPGIAYEYELHKRFLPEITLDEINRLGKDWASERNRVVMVNAPEKEGLKTPDEARLASVIKGATAKELQPYVDTVSSQALLDTLPVPGRIIRTASREDSGITEWELSNGLKVILKPTSFKQDEVVFRAFSPGGTSLASDQDFIPATTATQVLSAGGLGKFSAVELQKVLSGKVATARPLIGETEEGLSGSASPKDLETMFQLIYLTFTQPRPDPAIFGVVTARMKAMLANQKASPGYAFNETLQTTLSQNHLRARPMTPETIDGMNLEKSLAFYRERFADASDFTFVFVGNIDLNGFKPLVEQYLGSLPSLHRNETWKDVGIRPPKGVVQKTVKKGIEPKSQTAIVFTGQFQHDQAHRVAIRALTMVLETKLRETLREDLSGTYGVSVSAGYAKVPVERYNLSIGFGCNPERVEELVKVIFREISELKDKGPIEKQVADVREGLLRDYETNAKQNSYLLTQIYIRYQLSEDVKDFYALPDYYKKLTPASIQEAARAYLDSGNYVQVILLPEKQGAGGT